MTAVYILIVIIHGWGSGKGSNGNAVSFAEFTTQERCQAAADRVVQGVPRESAQAWCFPK